MKSAIAIFLFLLCIGCESVSINNRDLSDYLPDTQPEDKPSNLPDQDAIDISEIKWLGQDFSGAARDGSAIRSASIDNRFTYQDYTLNGWKTKTFTYQNPDGSVRKVVVNAIICLFYERNGLTGGKFDWMRRGGQPVKTLENVHDGYNGHTMPMPGARCYLMLVSVDGRFRTNVIELKWK